jgi:hypothetical protein
MAELPKNAVKEIKNLVIDNERSVLHQVTG